MSKGISVVICSYNSEHRIKDVLGCLLAQKNTDGFAWEVIMVDNASADNTVETARQSWHHPRVPLHIFHEPRQGQSYATRTGIKKAKYDIILMVDDDNYISPNYVSRAYIIMETHPEVGIAGGRGIGVFEKEPPAWFGNIEQAFAIGPQGDYEGYLPSNRRYIYGAGSIIRKPVYNYLMSSNFQLMLKGRIGKSLMAGEDTERSLAFRILGYKLWYDPSLEFRHYMPASRLNWNYIRRLYNSFGRTSVYFDLYGEILNKPQGIRAFVARYILTDFLNKLVKFLHTLPAYIKVSLAGSCEGKKEVLNFEYLYGRLSERIIHIAKIKQYRRRLKNAPWRNMKNN
jgi:glycosyltransferase involved in cell wall biosynthesis